MSDDNKTGESDTRATAEARASARAARKAAGRESAVIDLTAEPVAQHSPDQPVRIRPWKRPQNLNDASAIADPDVARAGMPPEGQAGAQSVEKATVDRETVPPEAAVDEFSVPPRASATGNSDPDARRTGSAPSVPLSRSTDRQGYLGPATAGFIGGLISAGIVAAGLFAFGPASDLGDRLSAMEVGPRRQERPEERSKLSTSGLQPWRLPCNPSGQIWTSSPSVRCHLTSGPSTAASIGWSAAFRKWHRGQRNPPLDRSSPHRPGRCRAGSGTPRRIDAGP